MTHFRALPSSTTQGQISGLTMDYYIGYANLPIWLSKKIPIDRVNQSVEIFAKEQGHLHIDIRSLSNGERLYVVFNARPYIRSTPLVKIYLMAFLTLLTFLGVLKGFFLFRLTQKISSPLEQLSHTLENHHIPARPRVSAKTVLPLTNI